MAQALRTLLTLLVLFPFATTDVAAQESLPEEAGESEWAQPEPAPDDGAREEREWSADASVAPKIEPEEDGSALETAGVTGLGAWTVAAWVGSPAALVAVTGGDVGVGEALVLSATNLLGVGTLGIGFGVMGAGAAMVVIGALGYIITFGFWDEAAALAMSGVVMMGVGALLTFAVAPLVFTFNAWLVDSSFGSRPDNIFLASGSLIVGSLMGGIGGFYLANLLVDIDEWPVLSIFAIVGTSLLVGNISYAMTRRATDSGGPTAVVILPPILF